MNIKKMSLIGMKHLKLFEESKHRFSVNLDEDEDEFWGFIDKPDCVYWKVKTEMPRFLLSIKKLGIIGYWTEDLLMKREMFMKKLDEIYILVKRGEVPDERDRLFYMWDKDNRQMRKNKYEYMGEVEIPDWEIQSYKYNL